MKAEERLNRILDRREIGGWSDLGDLAREAIALLRELEEWIPCIEVGSIQDGISCDKYLEKRHKFLDGEEGEK